jgi:hypothetical protein
MSCSTCWTIEFDHSTSFRQSVKVETEEYAELTEGSMHLLLAFTTPAIRSHHLLTFSTASTGSQKHAIYEVSCVARKRRPEKRNGRGKN